MTAAFGVTARRPARTLIALAPVAARALIAPAPVAARALFALALAAACALFAPALAAACARFAPALAAARALFAPALAAARALFAPALAAALLGAAPATAAAGHAGGAHASPMSALAGGAPATPFVSLPIGAGEAFQPPPRWPLAGQASFGGLRGDIHAATRAHLEVFAYRQVVVIPAGIGVSGGRTELYGTVVDALAHARAWTLQPGGVIQLAASEVTLGEFFAVWGQPLDLGFAGEVRAFVNGVERHGDPARITLRDGDQVVITVGGYVPPHRRFTFTPRRSP